MLHPHKTDNYLGALNEKSTQKVIFLCQTQLCPFIILPQRLYISFKVVGNYFGTPLVYITFKDPSNTVKGLSCN